MEPGVIAAITALVGPSAVVVDVGANVGYNTRLLAKLVGRAVEEAPIAIDALPEEQADILFSRE